MVHVEITNLEPMIGIEIRKTYPFSEIQAAFDNGMAALTQHLQSVGLQPSEWAGPFYAVYHNVEDPEAWDLSIGVPLNEPVAVAGDLKIKQIQGGTCAVTTMVGPYDGLGNHWDGLVAWMKESGAESAGDPRESYRINPYLQSDPSLFETDIIWPLK